MSKYTKQQNHNNASKKGTMAEKLGTIFQRGDNKNQRNHARLKNLFDYKGDGVDHINTYLHTRTPLGSFLSPFSETPFVHPQFGYFSSRQGMYCFLLSVEGRDEFREMFSTSIRNFIYKNKIAMKPDYPNLGYYMAQALWIQVLNNDDIQQLLFDNELPFDVYFIKTINSFDGKTTRVPQRPSIKINEHLEICLEIQKAIKEGTDPNFDKFIDDKDLLQEMVSRFEVSEEAEKEVLKQEHKPKQKKKKHKQSNRLEDGDGNNQRSYFDNGSKTAVVGDMSNTGSDVSEDLSGAADSEKNPTNDADDLTELLNQANSISDFDGIMKPVELSDTVLSDIQSIAQASVIQRGDGSATQALETVTGILNNNGSPEVNMDEHKEKNASSDGTHTNENPQPTGINSDDGSDRI